MIAAEVTPLPVAIPWDVPPPEVRLAADETHLWRARLDVPEAVLHGAWRVLSDDERVLACRFRFDHDRRRYIAAHGILRMILGRYACSDPRNLRFHAGRYGKPGLKDTPVRFNISHSGDMMLCAVAHGREVGVDVERVRMEFEFEGTARRIFSLRELAVWSALPEAEKPMAFFRSWVRKEAQVKARGGGLTLPVTEWEELLLPERYCDGRWSLQPLDPAPGYVGALVVECQDLPLIRAFGSSDLTISCK
ncbi:MAG: 4'-phosphopantetheinyl transferase superfamily protein [Acidobacteria bacterium]|nr:4'-phosphopantetheinyl transferase superfamily protein [Acidobacteriota bacterium]